MSDLMVEYVKHTCTHTVMKFRRLILQSSRYQFKHKVRPTYSVSVILDYEQGKKACVDKKAMYAGIGGL